MHPLHTAASLSSNHIHRLSSAPPSLAAVERGRSVLCMHCCIAAAASMHKAGEDAQQRNWREPFTCCQGMPVTLTEGHHTSTVHNIMVFMFKCIYHISIHLSHWGNFCWTIAIGWSGHLDTFGQRSK